MKGNATFMDLLKWQFPSNGFIDSTQPLWKSQHTYFPQIDKLFQILCDNIKDLDQEPENFFHKWPHDKYFRPCSPQNLCCKYSSHCCISKNSHRKHINEQAQVHVKKILFTKTPTPQISQNGFVKQHWITCSN